MGFAFFMPLCLSQFTMSLKAKILSENLKYCRNETRLSRKNSIAIVEKLFKIAINNSNLRPDGELLNTLSSCLNPRSAARRKK